MNHKGLYMRILNYNYSINVGGGVAIGELMGNGPPQSRTIRRLD